MHDGLYVIAKKGKLGVRLAYAEKLPIFLNQIPIYEEP